MPEENKNMTMAIIVVVVVIVIGIAIFLIARNNANSPSNMTNVTTPPPASSPSSNTKIFQLTSQNGSGQDGTVTLVNNGTTTKVTITLVNPVATAEPAHIHLGSCPTPGAVKYPLTNVINGSSVTNINVSFSDLAALGAIAVNVHKSAEDISTYVSCGDLTF